MFGSIFTLVFKSLLTLRTAGGTLVNQLLMPKILMGKYSKIQLHVYKTFNVLDGQYYYIYYVLILSDIYIYIS